MSFLDYLDVNVTMSEKDAAAAERPAEAARKPVPEGTGSESTAVPMPAQEENTSPTKVRPEREPVPKDLLVRLPRPAN